MKRSLLKLFDKIEKNRDALIVYKDKPIIIELDKNQDIDDYETSVFMGVLIDVESPVIYLKSSFYLDDDETNWKQGCFDDFIKLDTDREDFAADPNPVLEFERILGIFAPKENATPEQIRDMWLDPQYFESEDWRTKATWKSKNPHRFNRVTSPESVESMKRLAKELNDSDD